MCGVCSRQVRSWVLGRYPVPLSAYLIVTAYSEGMLPASWLRNKIVTGPPK